MAKPCIPILIIFLSLSMACATPSPPPAAPSPDPLIPWTPSRSGLHPGDLAGGVDLGARPSSQRHSPFADGPLMASAFIAWRLYSNTLSRSLGDNCRFAPTCSRFAVDALRLGPEGVIFTFARLQRNQLDDDFYRHTDDGFLIDAPRDYIFWRSPLGLDAHRHSIPSAQAWTLFLRAAEDLPEGFFDD